MAPAGSYLSLIICRAAAEPAPLIRGNLSCKPLGCNAVLGESDTFLAMGNGAGHAILPISTAAFSQPAHAWSRKLGRVHKESLTSPSALQRAVLTAGQRALRPVWTPLLVTLAMSCAGVGLPVPPPYGHVVLKSRGGRLKRFCMLKGSRMVLKPSSLILRTMVTKSAQEEILSER